MNEKFERTISLLGEENFKVLNKSKVVCFGLGGVGGTSAESLVRSGIGKLVIVDCDKVAPSNLNRQILFTEKDIRKRKVDSAEEKLKSINPLVEIEKIDEKVDETFFDRHSFEDVNYIIDAIDDCDGKLAIAKYAVSHNIPFIVSLGMGNRLDSSKVIVTKLGKTQNDPLARKIRGLYKKNGLDIDKIDVVWSSETPVKTEGIISSMMFVPSAAGLLMSLNAIKHLVK